MYFPGEHKMLCMWRLFAKMYILAKPKLLYKNNVLGYTERAYWRSNLLYHQSGCGRPKRTPDTLLDTMARRWHPPLSGPQTLKASAMEHPCGPLPGTVEIRYAHRRHAREFMRVAHKAWPHLLEQAFQLEEGVIFSMLSNKIHIDTPIIVP